MGLRGIGCGGRAYFNRDRVFAVMDRIHTQYGPVTFGIQGGANGADYLFWQWADAREVPCGSFNADWKKHGKKAGIIRNQQMLDEGKPDLVVAFPGGRGTADMVARARAAGVRVLEVPP